MVTVFFNNLQNVFKETITIEKTNKKKNEKNQYPIKFVD